MKVPRDTHTRWESRVPIALWLKGRDKVSSRQGVSPQPCPLSVSPGAVAAVRESCSAASRAAARRAPGPPSTATQVMLVLLTQRHPVLTDTSLNSLFQGHSSSHSFVSPTNDFSELASQGCSRMTQHHAPPALHAPGAGG